MFSFCYLILTCRLFGFLGENLRCSQPKKKTKTRQNKTEKNCRHCSTFNQLPAVRQGNPSGTVMPPLRIYLSYSQFSPFLILYSADKFPVSRFFIPWHFDTGQKDYWACVRDSKRLLQHSHVIWHIVWYRVWSLAIYQSNKFPRQVLTPVWKVCQTPVRSIHDVNNWFRIKDNNIHPCTKRSLPCLANWEWSNMEVSYQIEKRSLWLRLLRDTRKIVVCFDHMDWLCAPIIALRNPCNWHYREENTSMI